MIALAAFVLLASSTVRAEDLFSPGTMICTCTPAPQANQAAAAPVAAEEAPAPTAALPSHFGLYAGATSLALLGGAVAARWRGSDSTAAPGATSNWNTASTALLVGGAAMAGFSAAFLMWRF
jgi:hypothetical protein